MNADTLIKHEGFKVLKERLGLVNMERFIVLMNREKFDYTQWRKDLFNDMTIDELADKADKFSRSLKNA